MSVPSKDSSLWQCQVCTLMNSLENNRCGACLTKRKSGMIETKVNDETELQTNNGRLPRLTSDRQRPQPSFETVRKRRLKNSVKEHQQGQGNMLNFLVKKYKRGETSTSLDTDHTSISKSIEKNSNHAKSQKAIPNRTDHISIDDRCNFSQNRDLNQRKPGSQEQKRSLKRKQEQSSSISAHCDEFAPIEKTLTVTESTFERRWKRSLKLMKKVFSISSLRHLQPQAVEGALRSKHQIVVMATGGGKSLCYQLPALVLDGITIVVAPLIALMLDQVNSLKAKGICCALLSSSNKAGENKAILKALDEIGKQKLDLRKGSNLATTSPSLKLLYCTPEMVEGTRLRSILKGLYKRQQLAMIAIDEAHCLSCWGHSFRPAYLKLSWLRQEFPQVPVMACTATATKNILKDIRSSLRLGSDTSLLMSSFNRPNITYEVRYKDYLEKTRDSENGALDDLLELIRNQHKSNKTRCAGIVYVHKRADASYIASMICQSADVTAVAYHAGLNDSDRCETQNKWMKGEVQVVVATVAFGMGVDLAHVRYVCHWCLPKSIEGFYQESGRAGRDGLPSLSVLYYSNSNASILSYILKLGNKNPKVVERDMISFEKMTKYCTTSGCRRKYLLKHFGEEINDTNSCNKTCDYCSSPKAVEASLQISEMVSMKHNRSSITIKSNEKFGYDWDGQWTRPAGEPTSDYESDGNVKGDNLCINGMTIFGDVQSSDSFERNSELPVKKVPSRKKISSAKERISMKMFEKYEVSPIISFRW